MRFVFEMARREMRASWRRLLFFFICIAIGVASIVTLRSMIQNINLAVTGEARSLLTADVQVDSDRPWTPETLAVIDRIAQPLTHARTETIESATMVRPADPSREGSSMIELKGSSRAFPSMVTSNLQRVSRSTTRCFKTMARSWPLPCWTD